MRTQPTAAELLEIARTVIKTELLPSLPADKVYDALMAMNALGIAQRQIVEGVEPEQKELAELQKLLPDVQDLKSGLADLGSKIRAGEFDGELQDAGALYQFLYESTLQRLKESAPKYLKSM